jgi:hypothetical protein
MRNKHKLMTLLWFIPVCFEKILQSLYKLTAKYPFLLPNFTVGYQRQMTHLFLYY